MKKDRDDVVLLNVDINDKYVSEKDESEDMVVNLGLNGVVEQSTDTCDRVMEDVTLEKYGNGPVMEGSRKPSNEETKAKVVKPNVEQRTPKWSKSLIRKVKCKLTELVKVGTCEGKNEEQDNTLNGSLQSTIEVMTNDVQKSETGLTVETVERATESVREGTDAGLDSMKVLESVIKVDELVAVENLAGKNEAHDDEDRSLVCAVDPSLSTDVVKTENSADLEQKFEEEIDVADKEKELEDEVSDSLKIPDSSTVANLGSEEDDVEVVEEDLEEKDEVHEVVNAGTGESLTTERSELDDVAATDDEAGMDINEVLGWKDEFDEQKVDPTNLSTMDENVDVEEKEIDTLEDKQLYEPAVSFHQSRYFHPPENEGKFSVFDLVWGKVRSYPWWPGQIFDPSDASEKAMKYHKKDCFLIAFFGDRTFAWNESTVLKPFRSTFSQIANRTNSEAFNNAVHCALQEVSRRVELGLACSCIPHDIYENIKCQIVDNAGIKQESSKRHGTDKSASVDSFEPDKLVDYVRLLAKFQYGESDKMELTMAKAQLSSYGRYKRYRQLVEFQLCGDILETDEPYFDDGSKKRKALDSICDEPVAMAKPSFKVGASIRQDSINAKKRKVSTENDPEKDEFDYFNDSYWTDRIVQNNPNEQLLQKHQNGGREHQIAAYEQENPPAKPTRRSNKKRFFNSNHEIDSKEQMELIERRQLNLATELSMKYNEGIYFPSEIRLNKMFKRFGPLMESETEVDRQNGRARVVFKKCSDAEVALSSAGKVNIFGSILVNYELNYTPVISCKPFPPPLAHDTTDAC